MALQAATHRDGLAHVGYEGLLYNGAPACVITRRRGGQLGIEHVGPIVTRGILLDVARVKGVHYFDAGYAIDADELAAADNGTVRRVGGRGAGAHRADGLARARPATIPRSRPGVRGERGRVASTTTRSRRSRRHLVFEIYPREDPAAMMAVHMLDLRDMGVIRASSAPRRPRGRLRRRRRLGVPDRGDPAAGRAAVSGPVAPAAAK